MIEIEGVGRRYDFAAHSSATLVALASRNHPALALFFRTAHANKRPRKRIKRREGGRGGRGRGRRGGKEPRKKGLPRLRRDWRAGCNYFVTVILLRDGSRSVRNAAGIDDVAMRGPDTGEILFSIDLATVHAFFFLFFFC